MLSKWSIAFLSLVAILDIDHGRNMGDGAQSLSYRIEKHKVPQSARCTGKPENAKMLV